MEEAWTLGSAGAAGERPSHCGPPAGVGPGQRSSHRARSLLRTRTGIRVVVDQERDREQKRIRYIEQPRASHGKAGKESNITFGRNDLF